MKLVDKRIAILVEKLYEDLELWYPYYRLREAGAEVELVGTQSDTVYPSKHGYPARSDVAAKDVDESRYAGIVIPGGYAPDHLRRDPASIDLVRQINQQRKPVAAICHAAWMLVSADAVKGRTLTCFQSIRDDVTNAGGKYVDEEVVVDGNLVTSRQPADLPAFCRELIALLAAR